MRWQSIARFYLEWTTMNDQAAEQLFAALSVNTTLTSLNVSRNSIKVVGAKAAAEALRKNRGLSELLMAKNSIGSAGVSAIADAPGNGLKKFVYAPPSTVFSCSAFQ